MKKKKSLKARYWSLGIVLFLINYLVFATLFTFMFEADFSAGYATPTAAPTFTPAPAEPIIIVPTPIPVTPQPTPTATQVVGAPESNTGPGVATSEGIIQASAMQPDLQQANASQPAAPGSIDAPEKSTYQYEPIDWYAEENPELTRFSGEIKDTNGNPVNDVSVQARCGNYAIISEPSGAAGLGQPGFYEITIDTKPVPCIWFLTIIDTDDGEMVKAALSESVPVEITNEKSVVIANWRRVGN
jgi:hypothetical protein